LEKLRIIVVDEEHEPSYKQEETPHYQARDVAIMRGKLEGAVVILGSATPSLESFHRAGEGKYRMCRLLQRPEEIQLPTMHVVDLRTKAPKTTPAPEDLEKAAASTIDPLALPPPGTLIAPRLEHALRQRLAKNEQAIIFLNRRGYSSSIQCTSCGEIAMCPHCSVALTFHRQENRLRCHLCDFAGPVPFACPACGHAPYKYSGTGTEKVEHALEALFPEARIARMDADSMRLRGSYTRTLGDFAAGKIDFLVGTQMIAKGLHFPNVTCVGVINSDMALLLPDFRASERVFQLLMQVSGRSGRGDLPGEVFVQTRVPFHPSIQFARHHDYDGFAESELELRKAISYPPYSRFVLISAKGRNEDKVIFVMETMVKELTAMALPATEIIGPTPAPIAKIEDRYRYQIFLRTTRITAVTPKLRPMFVGRAWPDDVQVSVNVDPTDLL
jgi:primosomal protein N' (replication factor Y)